MKENVDWSDVFEKVSSYMENTAYTSSFIGYNIILISTLIGIVLFLVIKNTKIPGVIALLVAVAFGAFFLIDANQLNHKKPYILVGKLLQKYRISSKEKYRDDTPNITYYVKLNVDKKFNLTASGKGNSLPRLKKPQELEITHGTYLKLHEKGKVMLICLPNHDKVHGFITPEGETILN